MFNLTCINLLQVFNKDIDKDTVVLLAARAARLENQDAIDAAIVNMLADPREVRIGNFSTDDWFCSTVFKIVNRKCSYIMCACRLALILQKYIFCPSIQ